MNDVRVNFCHIHGRRFPLSYYVNNKFFFFNLIWIDVRTKKNEHDEKREMQTNKQANKRFACEVCDLYVFKWNEMNWAWSEWEWCKFSMNEDEIANDGHLSFCRMILEQLKTSGGDSFVLQSIHFVYVCVCILAEAATNDLIC